MLLKWQKSAEWRQWEFDWLNWILYGQSGPPPYPKAPRYILVPAGDPMGPTTEATD